MKAQIIIKMLKPSRLNIFLAYRRKRVIAFLSITYHNIMETISKYSVILSLIVLFSLIAMCCYEVNILIIVLFATLGITALYKITEYINLNL